MTRQHSAPTTSVLSAAPFRGSARAVPTDLIVVGQVFGCKTRPSLGSRFKSAILGQHPKTSLLSYAAIWLIEIASVQFICQQRGELVALTRRIDVRVEDDVTTLFESSPPSCDVATWLC